jgi:hypothetical protein
MHQIDGMLTQFSSKNCTFSSSEPATFKASSIDKKPSPLISICKNCSYFPQYHQKFIEKRQNRYQNQSKKKFEAKNNTSQKELSKSWYCDSSNESYFSNSPASTSTPGAAGIYIQNLNKYNKSCMFSQMILTQNYHLSYLNFAPRSVLPRGRWC